MEAGTMILSAGWNVDEVLQFLAKYGATVEQDNDGQIILYTGLFQHDDGALYSD